MFPMNIDAEVLNKNINRILKYILKVTFHDSSDFVLRDTIRNLEIQ